MPQGDSFEGTPVWFSGAGEERPANPFWTDPAKIAERRALIASAESFGVSPEVYYNALVHAGRNPNGLTAAQMTPAIAELVARSGIEHAPASGPGAAATAGTPGRVGPRLAPKFLVDFQRDLQRLPGMEARYGPYSKQPGLLKAIADITGARLAQRARMSPSERVYQGDRLARFDPAQVASHDALANIAAHAPENDEMHRGIFGRLAALGTQDPLATANQYLQQGTEAVTPEERGMFRQSAMRDVIEPLQDKMRRDLLEKILPSIDSNRLMHGNLYGGGRDRLRQKALDDFERNMMEASLPHLFEAENRGQAAGERRRQAQINAGQVSAPAGVQAIGAQREIAQAESEALRNRQLQALVAAEAGGTAGAARQRQEQEALNVAAQNWDAENRGMLDEVATAAAIARGQQLPTMQSGASPIVPSPSIPSVLGRLALGTGVMGMMSDGTRSAKAGGRMKLAGGGVASGNFSNTLANFRGSLMDSILNGGGTPSLASQAVQQDMLNQPAPLPAPQQPMGDSLGSLIMPSLESAPAPTPEVPAGGPLERGGQSAMGALEKMNKYRADMDKQAASLDSGAQDTNPMLSFLARTLIGSAGSKSLNLGEALGEGAQEGYRAFEQQRASNARNKELSLNIKKALLETHQKEHEHGLTLQLKRDAAELKANTPAKPKFYYNQQTGTHYTVGEGGQMGVAPGAPSPQTPKMKSEEELNKVRQVEAVKTEEANINKLQEDVNKTQKSIGNYNTMIGLMKDTGINKYMGPLKGKIYNNPKVQALLLSKKSVSEMQTFNAATNKAVLDDIKLTGSQPSDRDVKIVQDSKPSNTDTPQAALKKALINRAAHERNREFANFTKKMWREKGWPSYKSQEVFNRWQQANPIFDEDGQTILKPKYRPEDYEEEPREAEKSHDIIGQPDYGPDEVVKEYAPKTAGGASPSIGADRLLRDKEKIRAALAAKRAGVK